MFNFLDSTIQFLLDNLGLIIVLLLFVVNLGRKRNSKKQRKQNHSEKKASSSQDGSNKSNRKGAASQMNKASQQAKQKRNANRQRNRQTETVNQKNVAKTTQQKPERIRQQQSNVAQISRDSLNKRQTIKSTNQLSSKKPSTKKQPKKTYLGKKNLVNAMIYKEILDKPLSLRDENK
ncbi:hypothetical protein [Tetragenococcus halophilus]|uniref:hypothetical protein n=1 Tax=Tetragenococcus halophilus TaxID=51669 RepID=UPI00295F5495|nr:hypothetical protein [Tetragenococcus halophilus]